MTVDHVYDNPDDPDHVDNPEDDWSREDATAPLEGEEETPISVRRP